jgi:hypothetical protein
MYPSPGGYFTPGKMPGGYEYKANELGHLELWKGDVKVAVQSPDGSWFRDNIGTGVGSLHLGGNESGGVAHSLSSAGQNIGFKNEFSRATDDEKLFFYPPWQAVTCDGNERIQPSYTRYTSEKTANYPVGADSYSGAVPYDFPVTITSNAEVYDVYIRLGEVYTGTVKNSIISNVTGVEIFATDVQISGTEGQTIRIKYKYPFRARAGDNLQLRLIKEDGTNLMTHSGELDYNVPWRRIDSAAFEDAPIVGPLIGDVKHSFRTTDHEGWITMNGRATSTLTASQQANLTAAGINWASVPDSQGLVTMASGGSWPNADIGGSYTIARNSLPNFTLTGETLDTNTDHTHSGSTLSAGLVNTDHTHDVGSLAVSDHTGHDHSTTVKMHTNTGDGFNRGALQTSDRGVTTSTSPSELQVNSGGAHGHTISGTTNSANSNSQHQHPIDGDTGTMLSNVQHKHSYTTESINGNVTQTQHLQPYIALTQFVFVGL